MNPLYVIQLGYLQSETDSLIYTQVILYNMDEKKIVIIKVTLKTRQKLKRRGSKGDTYDDVITQMFSELEGDMRPEG